MSSGYVFTDKTNLITAVNAWIDDQDAATETYGDINTWNVSEIIDFSGLGEYISLPIKTYSEGMAARLIFSILTSFPHDCLAIDEGFGTGDAEFFEKAEKRMKEFVESSGTLLLASHSDELL